MNASNRQSGAVLLETITSMVIVSFVTVALMTLMGYAARGFVMVRDNTDTAGKIQVTMDRLRLEFENMQSVTAMVTGASANSITFVDHDGVSRTLAQDANNTTRLLLGGNLLLDNVTAFTLARTCGNQDGYSGGTNDLAAITVNVTVTGVPAYTLSVYPRRIMNCP